MTDLSNCNMDTNELDAEVESDQMVFKNITDEYDIQ